MKKNRWSIPIRGNSLRKQWLMAKFLFVFVFVMSLHASADLLSQNKMVTLQMRGATLEEVIQSLKIQTDFGFFYNIDNAEIKKIRDVNIDMRDVPLEDVLNQVLKGTGLTYTVLNNVVIIKLKEGKEPDEKKLVTIRGKVVDKDSLPIPGVTVKVVGTTQGVATNSNGVFMLQLPSIKYALEFSFVGYKTVVYPLKNEKEFTIKMEEEVSKIEEVVVNGFFTQKTNSYTGSVTSVKGEDLLKVSPNNILKALAFTVPGLHIVENNEQGANPNYIPEIILRGTTALAVDGQFGLNTPLIILDGVEISLQALYDIDMQDIDRVDVLKDASAKAMYGEKAANGVIVITRMRVTDSKLKVRYNFLPDVQFPDVSSFNLCNGREKLELERLCGLYDSPTGELDELYWQRRNVVERGASTDWKSIPLRNSWSFDHSVSITGRGGGMDYSVNLRYGDTRGIMKGDFRQRLGIGLNLSYNYKDFLTVSYRLDVNKTDSKDSPYGSYSEWVRRNPYDMPKDEYGNWVKKYNNNLDRNPWYEASLESFSKSTEKTITNNISFRVNLLQGLYVNGGFNYLLGDGREDKFISPESADFLSRVIDEKGSYEITGSDETSWAGNATLSYNWNLDEKGSLLSINLGGSVNRNTSSSFSFQGIGFLKPILNDINFASTYPEGSPGGAESKSSGVAVFGNLNFIYQDRYFVDGNYRASGSSSVSKEYRWHPYWSIGAGWNVHNEAFLKESFVNLLRLKVSYGSTGSNTLSSWETRTTYLYSADNNFITGVGARPRTMANEKLKASYTNELNLGIQLSLLSDRLQLDLSFYKKTTKDMLLPVAYPPSVGVIRLNSNLGEQENKGYDWSLSGAILKTRDLQWRVTLNGQHNRDKILKISNSLKYKNDENRQEHIDQDALKRNIYKGIPPKIQFEEGESASSIYVVPSLGIDPATGQDILVKKDGSLTFVYDANDKVAMGNTIPKLELALSTSFSYKGFSMFAGMNITRGGWIYNSTRADKIERIDPNYNVDRRAFTERWKNPGDLVYYRGYDPNDYTFAQSSRFVEKRNEFYLSSLGFFYEFTSEWVKHIYLKRLRIGVNFSDVLRLSTVKFERGTSYPYMRGFNFTISPTF